MSKILKFEPVLVGENYRFDADAILEEAKGHDFSTLVIIGEMEDGLWLSSSANAGEALVLMERAKQRIVFEDADD